MKMPGQRPTTASDGTQAAAADTTRPRPDPIAISPAIGPQPPVYLPPPGQSGPAGLLWHAAARAARRAGSWATRHLRRTTRASKSSGFQRNWLRGRCGCSSIPWYGWARRAARQVPDRGR